MNSSAARFGLAVALIVSAALFLHAHTHGETFPARLPLQSFPQQLDDWSSYDVEMEKDVLNVLGPGDFLLRVYQNHKEQQAPIDLFIAYFPSQHTGDTIHSPQHCLPGAGWTPIQNRAIRLSFPGHVPFPVNRYVIAKGDARQVVLYWYWAHDRGVASEYWAKFYLVADSIRMNRTDGALVRFTTPMYAGETVDAAQQRMMPFVSRVEPLLDNYIPR